MANKYNPIRSIDGVAVKCPSSYTWKQGDISASDAGRTEDGKMQKKRIGKAVSLELAWRGLSNSEVSAILNAFEPEYIKVCYLDARRGKFVTSEFYVGDRSAPLYNCKLNIWDNVAFNIIER